MNNKKDNNNLFIKILNNNLFLFLVPNLICWYKLFYYYNQNVKLIIAVLFYEVIVGCIIFLIINSLVYLLLKLFLKDKYKICVLMCLVSIFLLTKPNLLAFIIFSFFMIGATLIFKYLINFSLKGFINLISFIIIFLFGYNFVFSLFNVSYITLKSKSYDYEVDFETDDSLKTPNIYWIHCDGMMNMKTISKYLNNSNQILNNYLEKNEFYNNEDASLINGHKTARSLVALLNPYYYDEFYGKYLNDLENQFLKKKKNTDFIVNYHELRDKRINNELFQALEEKGYETIVLGDFNAHTSFDVDHYYDYYHYLGLGDQKRELLYFKKSDNSDLFLNLQEMITHHGLIYSNTMLYHLLNGFNILNHDVIDYNNFNFDKYPFTRNTYYWNSKAILKVIDKSYDEDKHQFTFIDYKLNHYPMTFDDFGNWLSSEQQYDLDYYFGNYVYSCLLLIEALDYIKTIDDNAVIILQGDHGIHTFENEFIMNELDININELQEIRNSVISAVYVPEKYRSGDEEVLSNPLNISRYLVNNFVGDNYEYID